LISQAIGGVEIRHIRRQRIEWQRQASMNAQSGDVAKAITAYAGHGDVAVTDDGKAALEAASKAFRQSGGDAVAVAATNARVADLNERLRQEATAMGLLHGPEIIIRAIPRGGEKPVDLALRSGDRLIIGGEVKIGNIRLRNASRIFVIGVMADSRRVVLDIGGQQILVKSADLERAGAGGRPLIAQHAYALTAHASQGATWGKTIWLPSHEDRRSGLVAMTRHTDHLDIIIDKSVVPRPFENTLSVGHVGMADPIDDEDARTNDEIIEAVGKSMQRNMRPRNALDLLGLPQGGQTVPIRLPIASVAASNAPLAMLPVRRPVRSRPDNNVVARLKSRLMIEPEVRAALQPQQGACGADASRPAARRSRPMPPPGFTPSIPIVGPVRTPVLYFSCDSESDEYAPGG
jgi:hypothetical protein